MPKPAKTQSAAKKQSANKSARRTERHSDKKQSNRTSKQSSVIAMLRSPDGATIAAMMKATDWQQHSVRGFLAGVVRKRLKLKLDSHIVGGKRVYRIVGTSEKPAKVTHRSV